MDNTRVGDKGLAHLKGLTRLRRLTLPHTLVTDQGVKDLGRLKDLEVVNLYRTRMTPAGFRELRSLLPGCGVEGD